MCWKCDYLFEHEDSVTPYMYSSGENETIPLSKTLFCDDSSYTCSEIEGAKQLLYKIGMFAAASGIWSSISKKHFTYLWGLISTLSLTYIYRCLNGTWQSIWPPASTSRYNLLLAPLSRRNPFTMNGGTLATSNRTRDLAMNCNIKLTTLSIKISDTCAPRRSHRTLRFRDTLSKS